MALPAAHALQARLMSEPIGAESVVVVVGANLAGGRAVEHLRRAGFAGRVVLIGAERDRPYDRPPLSKKYLRKQVEETKLFLRPAEWYAEHQVELELGVRATGLDTKAREVVLEDGRRVRFDRLLIATGADVIKLRCEGSQLSGVHYVRTLDDSRVLREELRPGRRAVVIGAGVIGAEAAAACREEGVEVAMLEASPVPLVRAFGETVGAIYAEVHRAKGVDLRCGVTATALVGDASGRVSEVVTSTGARIPCDFVIAGIGVRPNVGWLEGSGVEIEGGVMVDARCETSVPGIYAVGDVARWQSGALGRHAWVESVDNAQLGAAAAAANMLGEPTIYNPVPFFWSDQYDLKLQSVGHVGGYDDVVMRGSVADRKFAAFHVREGKLGFVVAVNRFKEIGGAKKLIASGAKVTREQLADESVSLASLAV